MDFTILLTFDVEDWFQVENFKQYIPYSSWPSCELRVEKNVHRILDLLDSINLNHPKDANRESASRKGLPRNSKPETSNNSVVLPPNGNDSLCTLRSAPCGTLKATFFILGWLAERLPHLVREIRRRGHEVASHGYDHELCEEQSTEDLKKDLLKSKKLLEDITGNPVYGYRAPSFSISDNILQLIRQTGYLYDSSFNSFGLHKRYGKMKLNGHGVVQAVTITARLPFWRGTGMPLGLSPMNTGTLRSNSSFSGAHMFPQWVGVPTTRASAS